MELFLHKFKNIEKDVQKIAQNLNLGNSMDVDEFEKKEKSLDKKKQEKADLSPLRRSTRRKVDNSTYFEKKNEDEEADQNMDTSPARKDSRRRTRESVGSEPRRKKTRTEVEEKTRQTIDGSMLSNVLALLSISRRGLTEVLFSVTSLQTINFVGRNSIHSQGKSSAWDLVPNFPIYRRIILGFGIPSFCPRIYTRFRKEIFESERKSLQNDYKLF